MLSVVIDSTIQIFKDQIAEHRLRALRISPLSLLSSGRWEPIELVSPRGLIGGGDRVRTCDLLRARETLFQAELRPPLIVEWWASVDSNHGPYAYQAYALNHLS